MRRLIAKLAIFLMVPVAVLAFPAWVLFASGESLRDDDLIALRGQTQRFLVGRAYSESTGYVKLKTVLNDTPEVLALGTSRVGGFRWDLFQPRFYNAGSGEYQQFEDLLAFLRRIPAARQPRLIVLGMDQKFFNVRWTEHVPEPFAEPPLLSKRLPLWSVLRSSWPMVYRDYFQRKFRLADLTKRRADGVRRIGLQAIAREFGYREDGSFTWPFWDYDSLDLHQIAHDERYYVYGSGVSDQTVTEVEAFLSECQRRGIHVAGFLPPFSPRVYQALEERPREYGFMFELPNRLQPLFERYGFSFADFTNPERCAVDRDGFFDGQHASERGYRRLWKCWVDSDQRLKPFSAELNARE